MEEENEKIYCYFKAIALILISVVVGFCVIFFIGVTQVNAEPYTRYKRTSDGNWSSWSNDSQFIGTENTIYNVDITTTRRSWMQYKDDVAMLSGKYYNFSTKLIITYHKPSKVDLVSNITIEAFNGSNLIDISSYCSTSISQNSIILMKQYSYTIDCVGISGAGYYPYISVQAKGDEAFTRDIEYTMQYWEYHLNTSSEETNTIINNNNQNTETITNNNNDNTQNIINNNNQNTEEIINNQNENTEKEIESQKVCHNVQYVFDADRYNSQTTDDVGYLNSSGNIINNQNWKVSDFIDLKANETYILTGNNTWINYPSYCIYNTSNVKENCYLYDSTTINKTITYTTDKKIRLSYSKEGAFRLTLKGKFCKNGNQAMNDSINDLNDSLTSDDIDTSLFSGFDVDVSDTGIIGIITSPLNAISNILSNTCSDITAPIPFTNKNFKLPCLTPIYEQHFPTILSIWQTVVTGVIAYWVCLNIFHMVHGFSDPNDDKIEVLEL